VNWVGQRIAAFRGRPGPKGVPFWSAAAKGVRRFWGGLLTTPLSPCEISHFGVLGFRRIVHREKRRRQESWYGTGFLLPPHSKTEHRAPEARLVGPKRGDGQARFERAGKVCSPGETVGNLPTDRFRRLETPRPTFPTPYVVRSFDRACA